MTAEETAEEAADSGAEVGGRGSLVVGGKSEAHEVGEFGFGEVEGSAGLTRMGEEDGAERDVLDGLFDNAFDGFFGQGALLS